METEYIEKLILELDPAEAVKQVLYPVSEQPANFTKPYRDALVAAAATATPRPVLRIPL